MIEKDKLMRLGLIGWPLGHSFSPQIHRAALDALGMKGTYELIPIPPEKEFELEMVCRQVREGLWSGLNVTIPFKQRVMAFVDHLTPMAAAVGAVNTLMMQEGLLVGDNTDAPGFLQDLEAGFGSSFVNSGKKALILGAGGAARAVTVALQNRDWHVMVAARRVEQARSLAKDLSRPDAPVRSILMKSQALSRETPHLIVNATPVGMHPEVHKSPWPQEVDLPQGAVVLDLVYNPPITCLMRQAEQAGLLSRNGAGMLVAQAALSFERWCGVSPSKDVMAAALHQMIENKTGDES